MVFPFTLPLVPAPATAIAGDGRMPITAATAVSGPAAAATQLIDAVEQRSGIRLSTSDGDADIALRIDSTVADAEGYTLTIGERAEVIGADDAGLFYGIQSLLQLLRQDEDHSWGLLRAEVSDAPRFPHRGVMLDVARHFFGVADVMRLIDAASALKLNRLHLHLSDDQGWRIEIESWPQLTAVSSATAAGGDPGGFYTKDDYREIVAHAQRRHMIVIPELDMPGHTHAVGVAYPELVDAPVIDAALAEQAESLGQPLPEAGVPYTGWGVGHSSLRIHDLRTEEFVRDVVRELAEMTPGPYLHLGGDESLGTAQADFDSFVAMATRIVTDAGKIPVGWHEMGSAPEIAEGTIGQYWGSTTPQGTHAEDAARFVARGGALIMSPSDAAYLDMKYTPDFPLGLTWAGTVDLHAAYDWEPTAVLDIPETAILGVEAPLWSETTRSFDDVAQLVFPRIAAQAEIAWSPKAGIGRSWALFRTRVASLAPLWTAAGIRFHAVPDVDWDER